MPGSAGSKYGVLDEGVPLKKNVTESNIQSKELKDLRSVIRSLLNKNKASQTKTP